SASSRPKRKTDRGILMWRRVLAAGAVGVLAGFAVAGPAQADERRCQGPHSETTTTTTIKGIATKTEGSPRQEVVLWDVRQIDGVRISCDDAVASLTAAADAAQAPSQATSQATPRSATRSTE